MTDKRSTTSAENGKKGGRPKGMASILAEKARDYIAQQLDLNLKSITDKAVEQANAGDKYARDWLSDRGWGKATQAIVTEDKDGNRLPILASMFNKE